MAEETKAPENIDQAIAAVMTKVGYVQKSDSRQLGYSYAGERAIIEALRPEMVNYGITMRVIEIVEHSLDTYTTSKGSVMNQTTLRARVRFTHAPSGTSLDCEALGQGADTGDKSANKAMTGAYKYAIRQTFMIETGDDPDDTSSNEQERANPRMSKRGAPAPAPTNPEWYGEFRKGLQDAEVTVKFVIEKVIGDTYSQETYQHSINRWLASNPEHSIGSLMVAAIEKKEALADGEPE